LHQRRGAVMVECRDAEYVHQIVWLYGVSH
jgi:hypothetical protein